MAAMVRSEYERQEDSYLAALLTAGSLSGLLNLADQMERWRPMTRRCWIPISITAC